MPADADDQPLQLTLSAAVRMALGNNPGLKEAREKIHEMAAQVPVTRAALLPTISASVEANHLKDASNNRVVLFNGDPNNRYQSEVDLDQPLFAVGSLSAIRSAKKDQKLSRLDAKISARDLAVKVIQTYYQVVLNYRNVEILKDQDAIERESLEIAKKRVRTGRSQMLDVLQIKTQLELLKSQLTNAQNQLEVSAATLANLLGNASTKVIRVENSLHGPGLSEVDADIRRDQVEVPELAKNRIQLAQINDKKWMLWGQNLPTVSATADYAFGSYKKAELFDGAASSWQVGVKLTVPLFSGLSTLYQQRALMSQKTQLEFNQVNIANQLNLQQVSNRKLLESAHQSIISGTQALKLAKQSEQQAKKDFRYATIDFLQFLSVEKDYIQAQFALDTDKYNYISALANYYSSLGQDVNKLVALLQKDKK